MIELLKQQFNPEMSVEEKINRVREALQLGALKIIYDRGYFDSVAFVGGTALRFLQGLKRFSEDLDFSLIHGKKYKFSALVPEIEKGFKLQGLQIETKLKRTNVCTAFF